MNRSVLITVIVTAAAAGTVLKAQAPAPVDPSPKQVPGSTVSLTTAQTRDAYNPLAAYTASREP